MPASWKTDLAGDFRKTVIAARRKAGKKIGPKIVKDRVAALKERNSARIGGGVRTANSRSAGWKTVNKGGQISPRRKRAVRSVVGADGTMVVLDLYPYAADSEYGATKRSAKPMFIQDKRRRAQTGDKIFFVDRPGGKQLVLAVKPWNKRRENGTMPNNNKNKHPRIIGVMTKQIDIAPMPKKWRIDTLAERRFDEYLAEVDRNLFKDS